MIRLSQALLAMCIVTAASCSASADTVVLKSKKTLKGTLIGKSLDSQVLVRQPLISLLVPADSSKGIAARVEELEPSTIERIVLSDSVYTTYDIAHVMATSLKDDPLTVAIGGNLDFLSGVQVKDVYYNLALRVPRLFCSEPQRFWQTSKSIRTQRAGRIVGALIPSGVSLGFEQGRLASRDSVVSFVTYARDSVAVIGRQTEKATASTDLSFGIYWHLWRPSKTVACYAVVLNEFRKIDAERVVHIPLRTGGETAIHFSDQVRERLMSYGVNVVADIMSYHTDIAVMFGDQDGLANGFGVYMIQGELREDHYGITIRGAVRGLRTAEVVRRSELPPSGDPRVFPEFQVAVAKTFGLERLSRFIIGTSP